MKASRVATVLLSITPLASAFPWPAWFPDLDSVVVRRQDDTSSSTSPRCTGEVSDPGCHIQEG